MLSPLYLALIFIPAAYEGFLQLLARKSCPSLCSLPGELCRGTHALLCFFGPEFLTGEDLHIHGSDGRHQVFSSQTNILISPGRSDTGMGLKW